MVMVKRIKTAIISKSMMGNIFMAWDKNKFYLICVDLLYSYFSLIGKFVHSKLITLLKMSFELTNRPRRLRGNQVLRSMTLENRLSTKDLVLPVFISDEIRSPEEIDSMPGVFAGPQFKL